jgi:hypothetical protein
MNAKTLSKSREDCSACEKAELEKKLEAEESARAFDRELIKLEQEHKNARDSAEESAVTELQKARWQSEFDLNKLFHEKVAEVAGGSIERSRDSAKYIQTVAAAIAGFYGTFLALSFSVGDNPLPLRGIYPAVFLGLAIALSAGYLAFLTRPDTIKSIYDSGASLTEQQLSRTSYLISWISSSVFDRRWAIRASVVSLAVGVAFLPAPFLTRSQSVEVPEAPTAPTIPATIASQVNDAAVKLFNQQAERYTSALEEHNTASEKAATAAIETPDREADLNRVVLFVALGALVVVLVGPLIYGHFRDR